MTIMVSRDNLNASKPALDALGKTYVPVGKGKYWFVRRMDTIYKAGKQLEKAVNKQRNVLIEEMGTVLPDGPNKGRKGILQNDTATMEKFSDAMDEFMAVEVKLDIEPLTLTQLEEMQISLLLEHQVALMWLISES